MKRRQSTTSSRETKRMAQPRRRGAEGSIWLRALLGLMVGTVIVWAWYTYVPSLSTLISTATSLGLTPTPTPIVAFIPAPAARNTPAARNNIGIISGHNRVKIAANGTVTRDLSGIPDPGAVCKDNGVTEAEITWDVAVKVANELRDKDKLNVELLGEFDPRLKGYFGRALVAIHVDSCIKGLSGFKVARLIQSAVPAEEDRLVNCLREHYATATGLIESRNTITPDMQEYHAFREIAFSTPGAIIELGFLYDDQLVLKQSDETARGVSEGIRCFLGKL